MRQHETIIVIKFNYKSLQLNRQTNIKKWEMVFLLMNLARIFQMTSNNLSAYFEKVCVISLEELRNYSKSYDQYFPNKFLVKTVLTKLSKHCLPKKILLFKCLFQIFFCQLQHESRIYTEKISDKVTLPKKLEK